MRAAPKLRYCGVALAWLLSLQAAGFTLQPVQSSASCCCARAQEHCHCPVCAHAREVTQPQPSARSCGEPGSPARDPAPRPFLAHSFEAAAFVPPSSPQPQAPPPPGGGDAPEVPTPPPLA